MMNAGNTRVRFTVRKNHFHMTEPLAAGTERIFTLSPLSIWKPRKPCVPLCINTPRRIQSQRPVLCSTWHHQVYPRRLQFESEHWLSILAKHVRSPWHRGKMNENGQTLLEFCCYHKLCVTNAYFQNQACHKASCKHQRSNHWYQLDLVITRCISLNNVCNTRAYHSADCNTDHSLISSMVKLKPKNLYH